MVRLNKYFCHPSGVFLPAVAGQNNVTPSGLFVSFNKDHAKRYQQ